MITNIFFVDFLDAMNSNKYFPTPNNVEFYEALEKALRSLKTRKWRYNKKRQQEIEQLPPNRRRRMDNEDEVCIHLFYYLF